MARAKRSTRPAESDRSRAVVYARASSKEQEKEGFSIPAQLKLLKEYAVARGFEVGREYMDVETAEQSGRTSFGEMVACLQAHAGVRVTLVEKTDRLYRNLKDWVTVDELGVEIHFATEGVVPSRESRSSEKLIRLSRPWSAISLSDARAATSRFESGRRRRAAGLVFRKSGAKVPSSTVARILRNRTHAGSFDWDWKAYEGSYEPIVSSALWSASRTISTVALSVSRVLGSAVSRSLD